MLWSQPEELEDWVSGLVVRPVGSPRIVWSPGDRIMSNTGEIDPYGFFGPKIAVDPYDGEYGGGDYRDTWIKARNVFVCFGGPGADPGYDPGPGHGWDKDNDGCIWVKYYDYDWCTTIEDPEAIRDPDDLVTTVIFKQVDP